MSFYRFINKMNIGTKVTLAVCCFALFIGLFTYRMGCNPAVEKKCQNYNLIRATVYSYNLPKKQCKKLKLKYCTSGKPYALAHYGTHNETCQFLAGNVVSPDSDTTDTRDYKIGTTYSLFQSKTYHRHCYTFEAVKTSWYFSTFFLLSAAICLGIAIRALAVQYYEIASGYHSVADSDLGSMSYDSLKRNDSLFVFRNQTVTGHVGVDREGGVELPPRISPNKSTYHNI